MMWVFLVLWVLTSVLLWGAFLRIGEVQSEQKSKSHAVCVASIFSVVGDAHAARTLRYAADRWDSIEEQPNIRRLAQQYTLDGASMPALWLRSEADRIDPVPSEESAHE